jgi:hypothetical protein
LQAFQRRFFAGYPAKTTAGRKSMAPWMALAYSASIPTRHPQGTIMKTLKNTLKNMEIIFTVAVAVACSASYVSFMQPQAASPAKTAQAASPAAMPVVTISARRMTAQEKHISLMQERQALLAKPAVHTL